MKVVGIDVGFSGGLCRLKYSDNAYDRDYCRIMPMPVIKGKKNHLDIKGIADFIREADPDKIIIEHAQAMPKQGVTSVFRYGEGFGMLQAVCATLGYPYELVRPQRWKKAVLIGYDKKEKAGAILYVQRKFPFISLLATPRCKKPHDGMADAICLAEYGIF